MACKHVTCQEKRQLPAFPVCCAPPVETRSPLHHILSQLKVFQRCEEDQFCCCEVQGELGTKTGLSCCFHKKWGWGNGNGLESRSRSKTCCSHHESEENGFLRGAAPRLPTPVTVTAGQAHFPVRWWPLSPRVFYSSGQLPAQPTPQADPESYLHGFCQDHLLSFKVVSPQPNVSRALGIWLSFFFQKLFDAQLQLHCSTCQTFPACRERLNREQSHGRNASLNKKLREQSEVYFPRGVTSEKQVPQHLIRRGCHLKMSLQWKEPFFNQIFLPCWIPVLNKGWSYLATLPSVGMLTGPFFFQPLVFM